MSTEIVRNGVILRVLGGNMRKFKRRQRHSVPFGLFLAVAGALLLPAAVAPRANAGSTGYWNFEDPLDSRPRPAPELFSQPQGVLINQPLASNYNPTLALNVASGDQPGAFQPLVPDATASWIGGTSTNGILPVTGPRGSATRHRYRHLQRHIHQSARISPQLRPSANCMMTTGVTQNVTLSATGAASSQSMALAVPAFRSITPSVLSRSRLIPI